MLPFAKVDSLARRIVTELENARLAGHIERFDFRVENTSQRIPYEAAVLNVSNPDLRLPDQRDHREGYVRVGNWIFLDTRLIDQLPQALLSQGKDTIFYLNQFYSLLACESIREFSVSTLAALAYHERHQSVRGSRVLDLGCGDGVLSLLALKMGADISVGVEVREDMFIIPQMHLAPINGIGYSQFEIIQGDLRERSIQDQIPKDATLVVANIGPTQAYADTHTSVFEILDQLPRARTFIGGGYATQEDLFHYNALRQLVSRGFTDTKVLYSNRGQGESEYVSFVARKPNYRV